MFEPTEPSVPPGFTYTDNDNLHNTDVEYNAYSPTTYDHIPYEYDYFEEENSANDHVRKVTSTVKMSPANYYNHPSGKGVYYYASNNGKTCKHAISNHRLYLNQHDNNTDTLVKIRAGSKNENTLLKIRDVSNLATDRYGNKVKSGGNTLYYNTYGEFARHWYL